MLLNTVEHFILYCKKNSTKSIYIYIYIYLFIPLQVYKEGIERLSLNCAEVASRHKVKKFVEVSTAQVYSGDKVGPAVCIVHFFLREYCTINFKDEKIVLVWRLSGKCHLQGIRDLKVNMA